MSAFQRIKFDLKLADTELASFRQWFATVTFICERAIVAEIKSRRHMACLLASTLGLPAPDMIKFELALKGMFKTDLVLGNDGQRKFGLVEFEDADASSISKRGPFNTVIGHLGSSMASAKFLIGLGFVLTTRMTQFWSQASAVRSPPALTL